MSNEKSSLKSCFFHFILYLFIAEISNTALMGMVQFAAELELALIYLNAYTPVCIPEWHSLKDSSVNLFYSKQIHIFRVIKYIRVYSNVLKHILCHKQALVHLLKAREKNIFQQLVIPVVAVSHVGGHKAYLIWKALDSVADTSEDLPYIGVFLVWHDA